MKSAKVQAFRQVQAVLRSERQALAKAQGRHRVATCRIVEIGIAFELAQSEGLATCGGRDKPVSFAGSGNNTGKVTTLLS